MTIRQSVIFGLLGAALVIGAVPGQAAPTGAAPVHRITHTDREWKRLLTPAQYTVLRQSGTDEPYKGAYWNNHNKGTYVCAGCSLPLFTSDAKFDSGTGWPSFWQPIQKDHVLQKEDDSLGTVRTEVTCARCGGHLGHVFDDGPQPTGLRYCMNSNAMKFIPAPKSSASAKMPSGKKP